MLRLILGNNRAGNRHIRTAEVGQLQLQTLYLQELLEAVFTQLAPNS
jgi:hypothetical protein